MLIAFQMGLAVPEHFRMLSMQLYVGPDQILPLTSWLAGVVGFLLIFWRHVTGLAGRFWRFILRRK